MSKQQAKSGKSKSALLGAAFLMATSSIGPGFLTQTTLFTAEHLSSLACVIAMIIIMDIVVQDNISSVIGASGLRGQEVANKVLPGLGVFLALMVSFGGLAFNIGNVGGVALGLNALAGIPEKTGYLIAGGMAIAIFLSKNGKSIMDRVAQVLGGIIIVAILGVCLTSHPPVGQAAKSILFPENPGSLFLPMVTLLGGSCGGYITFAGAHRLLDGGYGGGSDVNHFRKSAFTGVCISCTVRILLFLAVLGVCTSGTEIITENVSAIMGSDNPPAVAFELAAGSVGRRMFGLVAAGTTCVVGAAYTSVSFLKTLHPFIMKHERMFIVVFIAISTLIMYTVGGAKSMVVIAGAVNGFILPIALACILLACRRKDIVGDYKQPVIMQILGWGVVVLSGVLAISALPNVLTLF